jgi:hypothetical protein
LIRKDVVDNSGQLVQLAGTRAGGFVRRQEAAGKWGAVTVFLGQDRAEA